MGERIMTLHPAGKQGVNLDKAKYETIRQAILAVIGRHGAIPFGELASAVEASLTAPFAGSIGWYTTTVKLDLEARGLIERAPGRTPQELRLVQSG